MQIIANLVATAFTILELHIYWALGGKLDIEKMVPVVNDKPVFVPGVFGTFVVASVLLCFAAIALILGFNGFVLAEYLPSVKYAGFVVGAILVLRAIGEFKYVGFFKRVRGSDFAKYDDWIYSPFCFLAGNAFFYLGVCST
jgi:hypothetical protein